jgi:uroporphyrinogen-III synthase
VRSSHRRPIVITRPAAQAVAWQQALQAAGHPVVLLPCLSIHPAPDVLPLRSAWAQLVQWRALMFVSANAIEAFFAQRPADMQWPQDADAPRAWVPGPASAKALEAAAVPAHLIDAPDAQAEQFDSESLWEQVRFQVGSGFQLLVVRGGRAGALSPVSPPASTGLSTGIGREWLAEQVESAGGSVGWLLAYVRSAPAWTDAEYAQAARARDDGAVWLFSSSECVAHLQALTHSAPAPWRDSAGSSQSNWSGSVALATHPRIAKAARTAGFGTVHLARPGLADVLASIESFP